MLRISDHENQLAPRLAQLRRLDDKLGCAIYDASELTNVTHVLDLDGFVLNKTFHPKEACLLELKRDIAWRADVWLPCTYQTLAPSEQHSVTYVTHKVHGMFWTNFAPNQRKDRRRCMLRDLAAVDAAIKKCLERWRKNEQRDARLRSCGVSAEDRSVAAAAVREPLVAYKGGTIERNLLARIGVASVDLHYYGCPKFDYLMQKKKNVSEYRRVSATSAPLTHINKFRDTDFVCDLHSSPRRSADGDGEWHCPVVECRVFARWIELAVQSWRLRETIMSDVARINEETLTGGNRGTSLTAPSTPRSSHL